MKIKFEKIENLLNEIITLITIELGNNPYEDIDKAKRIVSQKNFNQTNLLIKKLDNFTMLLYNRRLNNAKIIIGKLSEVYSIIND